MKSSMNRPGEKSPRLAYVDNQRALMIIFVVMIHVGVTYSGLGSWYYKENQDLGPISLLLFGVFQSFTQAYSMGLLFLFAGYFIPGALERKGAKRFVNDRLFRLGVPVLVYIFIIHPVCIAIAYPDTNIADYYIRGIVSLDFVSWSGPLWFAFALLIFTLVYLLISKLFGVNLRGIPRGFGSPLTLKRGLLLVAVISAAAFALRTAFPIGTDVINMQLGYFSSYAVMFVMGVTGLRKSFLDGIDHRAGKMWFIFSFAVGLPVWILIILFGGPLKGVFLINGGMNWQAAAFAFWESFFCVAMIIGLIGIFKERFNSGRPAARFLSDQAFGVYVFHAPVLILVTKAVKGVSLHPLAKFCVVSVLAVSASYLFSYAIRRVGFLRRVFS